MIYLSFGPELQSLIGTFEAILPIFKVNYAIFLPAEWSLVSDFKFWRSKIRSLWRQLLLDNIKNKASFDSPYTVSTFLIDVLKGVKHVII